MEVWSALLLTLGACIALALTRHSRLASRTGCAFALMGCLGALGGDLLRPALLGSLPPPAACLPLLFRLPVELVGACAAVHTLGYLKGHGEEKSGIYWFLYNLTLASMLAVTAATTFWRFAVAWEFMGLFSAGLVAFDARRDRVRNATWTYLVACHAGILLLIAAIALKPYSIPLATAALLLGFGLKAGFPGLHVWLPEAHPAAPAPVSALMSAAMVNLGLYGILRFLPYQPNLLAIGASIALLGAIGALGGILFALSQSDIKRLLAYSTIENIGIITLAGGVATLGLAANNAHMCLLASSGAGLHLISHAFLKASLFLGAGAIYKATGTLDSDSLGGLARKMPRTATLFLLNAIGICGLPPMNGFLGELLIYLALFEGIATAHGVVSCLSVALVIALALTGGFAALAFARLYSSVFQGEPRSEMARQVQESPVCMILPQSLLLACSILMLVLMAFMPFGGALGRLLRAPILAARVSVGLVGLTLLLLLLRRFLLPRTGTLSLRPTWDCGYAEPTARMAYTGSAFAQPATDFLAPLTGSVKVVARDEGLFPSKASIAVETPDAGVARLWRPLFRRVARLAEWSHRLQAGYLHLYILAMALAVVAMLVWGFVFN
ncbi:MAG: proton-conducting transporter membrane subunit [Kiritimatiellia bacterium]